MAARRLTSKERKELPSRAFGIPSSRKYPVMVLNRSGEPVPSKGHAVDAKGRAKEELEKGRIDKRQYNQIVRKADSAIRSVDRSRKKAKRNPPKKKKASKRKVAKRKVGKKTGFNPEAFKLKAGKMSLEHLELEFENLKKKPGGANEKEKATILWTAITIQASGYDEPKGKRRRKNPSEADHERVGMEALRNSHEYWDGYLADKSKTNLLVDAYKFLVIAHEELKYAGDAEPRLEVDHMLKAAHKELSKKLK